MGNEYADFVCARRGYGRNTQNAGTVITQLIEPRESCRPQIAYLRYRNGTSAQILTLMRPITLVRTTAAAAASQAVINISSDPGNFSNINSNCSTANNLIAGSDYVVYQAADGTYVLDTVSSVSTLAITMTTNCPTGGVLKGAPFWWFGVVTDTNPNNAQAHPRWNILANQTLVLGRGDGLTTCQRMAGKNSTGDSFAASDGAPLIIHSDNASNAGFLESVGVEYIRRSAIPGR